MLFSRCGRTTKAGAITGGASKGELKRRRREESEIAEGESAAAIPGGTLSAPEKAIHGSRTAIGEELYKKSFKVEENTGDNILGESICTSNSFVGEEMRA